MPSGDPSIPILEYPPAAGAGAGVEGAKEDDFPELWPVPALAPKLKVAAPCVCAPAPNDASVDEPISGAALDALAPNNAPLDPPVLILEAPKADPALAPKAGAAAAEAGALVNA